MGGCSSHSYEDEAPSGAPRARAASGRAGLTGLRNLGNSCYMNSALQCLSNTRALSEYLLQSHWQRDLNTANPLGMRGKIATSYVQFIKKMWTGSKSVIAPTAFKNTVGEFAPRFAGYQQQDSQEFLSFLLDGLHEDLNRIKRKPYIEERDSDGRSDLDIAEEQWSIHLQRNRSIVVDLLQGQLKSTLQCSACNYRSVRFDPFMYLTLPLESPCGQYGASNIGDAVDLFSLEEQLTGQEAWFCGKCKKHVTATKRLELWRLPPVLIIHLKRFKYGKRCVRGKITAMVDFPLTGLQLADNVAGPQDPAHPPTYSLYAVSNHHGGLGGGHYTAFAKNAINQKWYYFNDSFVREIAPEDAVTRDAYVLFYRLNSLAEADTAAHVSTVRRLYDAYLHVDPRQPVCSGLSDQTVSGHLARAHSNPQARPVRPPEKLVLPPSAPTSSGDGAGMGGQGSDVTQAVGGSGSTSVTRSSVLNPPQRWKKGVRIEVESCEQRSPRSDDGDSNPHSPGAASNHQTSDGMSMAPSGTDHKQHGTMIGMALDGVVRTNPLRKAPSNDRADPECDNSIVHASTAAPTATSNSLKRRSWLRWVKRRSSTGGAKVPRSGSDVTDHGRAAASPERPTSELEVDMVQDNSTFEVESPRQTAAMVPSSTTTTSRILAPVPILPTESASGYLAHREPDSRDVKRELAAAKSSESLMTQLREATQNSPRPSTTESGSSTVRSQSIEVTAVFHGGDRLTTASGRTASVDSHRKRVNVVDVTAAGYKTGTGTTQSQRSGARVRSTDRSKQGSHTSSRGNSAASSTATKGLWNRHTFKLKDSTPAAATAGLHKPGKSKRTRQPPRDAGVVDTSTRVAGRLVGGGAASPGRAGRRRARR